MKVANRMRGNTAALAYRNKARGNSKDKSHSSKNNKRVKEVVAQKRIYAGSNDGNISARYDMTAYNRSIGFKTKGEILKDDERNINNLPAGERSKKQLFVQAVFTSSVILSNVLPPTSTYARDPKSIKKRSVEDIITPTSTRLDPVYARAPKAIEKRSANSTDPLDGPYTILRKAILGVDSTDPLDERIEEYKIRILKNMHTPPETEETPEKVKKDKKEKAEKDKKEKAEKAEKEAKYKLRKEFPVVIYNGPDLDSSIDIIDKMASDFMSIFPKAPPNPLQKIYDPRMQYILNIPHPLEPRPIRKTTPLSHEFFVDPPDKEKRKYVNMVKKEIAIVESRYNYHLWIYHIRYNMKRFNYESKYMPTADDFYVHIPSVNRHLSDDDITDFSKDLALSYAEATADPSSCGPYMEYMDEYMHRYAYRYFRFDADKIHKYLESNKKKILQEVLRFDMLRSSYFDRSQATEEDIRQIFILLPYLKRYIENPKFLRWITDLLDKRLPSFVSNVRISYAKNELKEKDLKYDFSSKQVLYLIISDFQTEIFNKLREMISDSIETNLLVYTDEHISYIIDRLIIPELPSAHRYRPEIDPDTKSYILKKLDKHLHYKVKTESKDSMIEVYSNHIMSDPFSYHKLIKIAEEKFNLMLILEGKYIIGSILFKEQEYSIMSTILQNKDLIVDRVLSHKIEIPRDLAYGLAKKYAGKEIPIKDASELIPTVKSALEENMKRAMVATVKKAWIQIVDTGIVKESYDYIDFTVEYLSKVAKDTVADTFPPNFWDIEKILEHINVNLIIAQLVIYDKKEIYRAIELGKLLDVFKLDMLYKFVPRICADITFHELMEHRDRIRRDIFFKLSALPIEITLNELIALYKVLCTVDQIKGKVFRSLQQKPYHDLSLINLIRAAEAGISEAINTGFYTYVPGINAYVFYKLKKVFKEGYLAHSGYLEITEGQFSDKSLLEIEIPPASRGMIGCEWSDKEVMKNINNVIKDILIVRELDILKHISNSNKRTTKDKLENIAVAAGTLLTLILPSVGLGGTRGSRSYKHGLTAKITRKFTVLSSKITTKISSGYNSMKGFVKRNYSKFRALTRIRSRKIAPAPQLERKYQSTKQIDTISLVDDSVKKQGIFTRIINKIVPEKIRVKFREQKLIWKERYRKIKASYRAVTKIYDNSCGIRGTFPLMQTALGKTCSYGKKAITLVNIGTMIEASVKDAKKIEYGINEGNSVVGKIEDNVADNNKKLSDAKDSYKTLDDQLREAERNDRLLAAEKLYRETEGKYNDRIKELSDEHTKNFTTNLDSLEKDRDTATGKIDIDLADKVINEIEEITEEAAGNLEEEGHLKMSSFMEKSQEHIDGGLTKLEGASSNAVDKYIAISSDKFNQLTDDYIAVKDTLESKGEIFTDQVVTDSFDELLSGISVYYIIRQVPNILFNNLESLFLLSTIITTAILSFVISKKHKEELMISEEAEEENKRLKQESAEEFSRDQSISNDLAFVKSTDNMLDLMNHILTDVEERQKVE